MKEKIGLDKFSVSLLSILTLLLFSSIFNHSLVYIALMINIYLLMKGNITYIFCQLFFLLPFAMIYKASPSSSSFFTYLMIASALYFVVIKRVNVLLLFPIAIYFLIGGLENLSVWLKIMMGFVLLLSFVKYSNLNLIKVVIVTFSIGLIVSSIIGTLKLDVPQLSAFYSDFNEEYIGGVKIARFSGLYQDPNFFSISIIMAVFLLISLMIRKLLPISFGFILVSVLIYFGCLSYSKMFILSLILVLITQLSSVVLKSKYKILGIIVAVLFLIFIGYSFFTSTYFSAFSTRLDTDDLSNNRTVIWGYYFDYLSKKTLALILGSGLNAPLVKDVETHNTYIEALYILGIIGSILYLLTIRAIFKVKSLVKNVSIKDSMLLFIFAVMIFTLHVLLVHDVMFYIIFIWISFNLSYYEDFTVTYQNGIRRY